MLSQLHGCSAVPVGRPPEFEVTACPPMVFVSLLSYNPRRCLSSHILLHPLPCSTSIVLSISVCTTFHLNCIQLPPNALPNQPRVTHSSSPTDEVNPPLTRPQSPSRASLAHARPRSYARVCPVLLALALRSSRMSPCFCTDTVQLARRYGRDGGIQSRSSPGPTYTTSPPPRPPPTYFDFEFCPR